MKNEYQDRYRLSFFSIESLFCVAVTIFAVVLSTIYAELYLLIGTFSFLLTLIFIRLESLRRKYLQIQAVLEKESNKTL